MALLIERGGGEEGERKLHSDILRVVASMRSMDDNTLWRFVKTLAYSASQHPHMSMLPFDAESAFVIRHHDDAITSAVQAGSHRRPPSVRE